MGVPSAGWVVSGNCSEQVDRLKAISARFHDPAFGGNSELRLSVPALIDGYW